MKKKTAGKKISFHGQWQSKPESEEMIYLFIYFLKSDVICEFR